MTDHVAFFGDRECRFRIAPELIPELERKTGTGIGALFRRLIAGDFRHDDILEVIRLGLIGGGTAPAEASALVQSYAIGRPLAESFPLAVAILELLWFGDRKPEASDGPA